MALPGARVRAAPAADLPFLERAWLDLRRRFAKPEAAAADEARAGDAELPEVAEALKGHTRWIVRVDAKGRTIVSMAVPISNANKVQGALLLSTQPGDIDKIIASDRWALFRVFLVAAVVMFVLSLFLANTIAGPIRRLAEAAERVRRGVDSREEIPDFTARADEIGHLSRALRDMTKALYSRMEATESFAADVAHELKNPLTSLRSAVETLPRIRSDDSRGRLTAIIQHDIRRLDRLISDISDASRLDAELARNRMAGLDVATLVRTVVAVAGEVERGDGVRFALSVALPPPGQDGPGYRVMGHDSRLGQVVNNLIDNARSFSAEDGVVRVAVRPGRSGKEHGDRGIEIVVDDDGPGIPAHAFERIFERFYTDRPDQGFGQNSGLGLSISRQIIEAHGGRIWATNRTAPAADDGSAAEPRVLGARFVVWLPAMRP
jgi:two-component system sensor histidine kinase ChvG